MTKAPRLGASKQVRSLALPSYLQCEAYAKTSTRVRTTVAVAMVKALWFMFK